MGRRKVIINQNAGKRLKQLLDEQKATQKDLSEKINLSQQQISKIMNGKANLIEDNAKNIIKLYPDYNLDWLMDRSEIKNSKSSCTENTNKEKSCGYTKQFMQDVEEAIAFLETGADRLCSWFETDSDGQKIYDIIHKLQGVLTGMKIEQSGSLKEKNNG